ncbi:hypothetical protein D3C78_1413260 [compost metagenome]
MGCRILVGEADDGGIAETRQPFRRALHPAIGGHAPCGAGKGRAAPQRTLEGIGEHIVEIRGFLRVERTEAEAMQVKLRPRFLGQRSPVAIDGLEQGARGLDTVIRLRQQGDPAGKIGILHGDAGDIAVMQIFDRIECFRIDPAGAGGNDHHKHLAFETADPFQFLQR